MPIGFEFNEWNLPLDQELHRFMNFTQWGDKVTWDQTLKRPQMITSLEWDPMSWMTSDNEVEIRHGAWRMKESVRSFAEISVDIGTRNTIGSFTSLKNVLTSRRRA
jgi:hypothetical protein